MWTHLQPRIDLRRWATVRNSEELTPLLFWCSLQRWPMEPAIHHHSICTARATNPAMAASGTGYVTIISSIAALSLSLSLPSLSLSLSPIEMFAEVFVIFLFNKSFFVFRAEIQMTINNILFFKISRLRNN